MLANEPSAKIIGRVSAAHTGPGMVPVPTSKTGQSYNVQDTGQTIQNRMVSAQQKIVLENKNTVLISPNKSYFKKDDRLKQTYSQSPKM